MICSKIVCIYNIKLPVGYMMEKKQVSFRLDRGTIKLLKFLAVEQERSLTDLYVEAIHDLLKKYRKEGND